MPRSYSNEAVEHCLRLYLKFNGQNHERIESEMRKAGWSGWSKQNLYTRGKAPNQKLGWIEKYGWEKALKLHLDQRPAGARTAAQKIFDEIEEVRQKIHEALTSQGVSNRDLVYQHSAYLRLSIEALNKLDGAGQSLDSFVALWESLMDWLADISPKALAELLKVEQQILDKAAAEYGDKEESAVIGRKV